MVLAPLTVCHGHWVLYPFLEGDVDSVIAMDMTGAVAFWCKRTMKGLTSADIICN